jgi:protein SCO1/2
MNTRRALITAGVAGVASSVLLAGASPRTGATRGSDFPNPLLVTHTGQKLRFYDDIVKGDKAVLFNMMYANCQNICPPNTASLLEVQKIVGERMGKDVFFYSLTLQPDFDRPADLQAYAKRYRVGPGWTFLTGARKDIEAIRRKLGFFSLDPEVDADLSQHTGMVRMGNEARDRWSMMPSLIPPSRLARSIVELAS